MLPGDFCVVATPGLMAALIRIVTRSTVNHAFILVAPGRIIEAEPGGAAESDLANYDGMYQVASTMPLTEQQRADIVKAARSHIGDGYSWVDDAAIALTDLLGWHVPAAVRKRLANPHRLECAQLVDQCYLQAGFHLWDDGRLPGDVAPSDLLLLIEGH
jgi:hypothetical protein